MMTGRDPCLVNSAKICAICGKIRKEKAATIVELSVSGPAATPPRLMRNRIRAVFAKSSS